MQIPELLFSGKRISNPAVTNALSCSRPRLPVGPVPLTTAPVPSATKRARHERYYGCRIFGGLSACGSATVVSLRLRSCVSAPLLHLPVHRTAGRSHETMNRWLILPTRFSTGLYFRDHNFPNPGLAIGNQRVIFRRQWCDE